MSNYYLYSLGLPKPAIVNQGKAIGFSKFLMFGEMTAEDTVYTTTPLYHSAATLALLSVMALGEPLRIPTRSMSTNLEIVSFIQSTVNQLLSTPIQ